DVAFFTARDDNSIGESISGSMLPATVANPALSLYNVNANTVIQNLEIRRAMKAIDDYSPYVTHTIASSRLAKCDQGLGVYYTTNTLDKLVMFEVTVQTYNYGFGSFSNPYGTISG